MVSEETFVALTLMTASCGLYKTTRMSLHHVAEHRLIGSETPPPYTPQNSRYGSELPSVEDAVDIWCYAILELHARNDDKDYSTTRSGLLQ